MITPICFNFLTQIQTNNNKAWFDEHRAEYDAARENFIFLIHSIIEIFGKKEPSLANLNAKDCVYRFNRDLRFSKDKRPYKSNFSAFFHSEGRKTLKAGYYISLQPGNTFVGGGLWQPQASILQNVRQEIDYHFDEFKNIIQSKNFMKTFGALSTEEGSVLTRVPKGYDALHPAAEFLKLKSFIADCAFTDQEVFAKNFAHQVSQTFETMQPFINFLNRSFD